MERESTNSGAGVHERRFARAGASACSSRRLVAFATGCTLVVTFEAAADSRPAQVEELLSEAARANSAGDFATAWTSHRRAWEIAAESPEAGDALVAYCERRDCPNIRTTGWLLGRPYSDLAFLAESCRGKDSDACRLWFNDLHRLRAQMGSERQTPGQPTQDVEMRFHGLASGDLRPRILAAVGSKRIWAIPDSGSPHVILGRHWANLHGLDYVVAGDYVPRFVIVSSERGSHRTASATT